MIDTDKLFADSKELKELYFWKNNFDMIINYVQVKFPDLYKYVELRFFNRADIKEIKNILNIGFGKQEKLDRKLFALIDKQHMKKNWWCNYVVVYFRTICRDECKPLFICLNFGRKG